jgi:arginine/ornithine N-succinyltransferase beta subunit
MVDVTGGYGRAASWVRFLWASMPDQRHAFQDRDCLAEMLPPFADDPESGRTNAFYEAAVRPHLDGRPYEEMDLETLRDRTLIGRRLPPRIRLADLPEDARSVIGQVGPKSRPALKLLEKAGFRGTGRVDPLDAGPHYAGRFSENPIFRGARDLLFGGSSDRPDEIGWTYGLMGVHRPDRGVRFRAAMGPFFVVEDNLFTTPRVAEGLILRIGDRITAAVAPL